MKKKLSKQASPDSYDFTIGRTKNVKTDASVGAEQIDQGFDDFDQVRYIVRLCSSKEARIKLLALAYKLFWIFYYVAKIRI